MVFPYFSTSRSATLSTYMAQCGLPQDTAVIWKVLSSTCTGCSTNSSSFVLTGITFADILGAPISALILLTRPSVTVKFRCCMPPKVSITRSVLSVSLWSYTYFPTLRNAFPHISPSVPSGLNIRIRKSPFSDGQINTIPSEPMAKCRSLTNLASSGRLSRC